MKIGIFTDTYKPNINGVVTSIDIKKKELEKLGYEVVIIAPKEPGYNDIEEGVYRLKSFSAVLHPEYRLAYPPGRKTLKFLESLSLDIIHAETPFSIGILATYFAKLKRKPLIHTYHTLFPEYVHYLRMPVTLTRKAAEKISAVFCNRCDHIISPSSKVKNELLRYGVKREISVIPTGIDVEEFRNIPYEKLKEETNIRDGEKTLLYVGRLGKEKNIEFLLDSISVLEKKYKEPFKFVIVGDGPYKNVLLERIEKLGIKDKVKLTGYVERKDIAGYYNMADIFIFSSLTETQGLVVLEAMSAGTPVVAVKASGVEDMICDCISGFLTAENLEEFTDKICDLFTNVDLYEEISKNAVKCSEDFTPGKTFSRFIEIYENTLENRRRARLRRKLARRRSRAVKLLRKITRRPRYRSKQKNRRAYN